MILSIGRMTVFRDCSACEIMKIGYPCIHTTIGCSSASRFRLKSYNESKLVDTINGNLDCLKRILEFNIQNLIYHFRITSDLIPFASHQVNTYEWQADFQSQFIDIGNFLKKNDIRISMHPGQYTVLNTKNSETLGNTIRELQYHDDVLSSLGLDRSAKIQIHVGGVYGDKKAAIVRFIERFNSLEVGIKERLIIENDERSYSVRDCIKITDETGIPIIVDTLHHNSFTDGLTLVEAIDLAASTWNSEDGVPLVDYSSQEENARLGKHSVSIDSADFQTFLESTQDYDFDVMLEIKDKEVSAMKAIAIAQSDPRFWNPQSN